MVTTSTDDTVHTAKEAIKRPHRATRLPGGIYPVTGVILAGFIMLAFVIYFA